MDKEINYNNPAVYRIRLQENLGSDWNEWFGGLTVTPAAEGGTILAGIVADQAALHGLIRKTRDLGLTLVSLQRLESRKEKGESS